MIVTVALLGLLVTFLAPALAGSRVGGRAAVCVQNTRRLNNAWTMYAQENHDQLVQNFQGGLAQGGNFPAALGPAWASGWLDWSTSADNTNRLLLVNERYAALARYLGPQASVFKCPADTDLSPLQKARGWTERARSYSLSAGLGRGNAESGQWDVIYRHATNVTDLVYPSPAETFVYVDENSDSINDPAFYSPARASLSDIPAARHNGAAAFSFADGHAELHQWTGSLRHPSGQGPDPDLHWLSLHTQRTSTLSY